MSANRRPTHLTLLVHAGINEAVGGTFSRRTGYRQAGLVSPTVVDDRSFILEQVSVKIANQLVEAPDFAKGVAKSGVLIQLGKHLFYGLACLSDISTP